MPRRAPADLIPVTVLTGFLGSGKTTVLSRLLGRPAFANTAVVINEFGEISLDHALVEKTSEDIVELQGGCLCCTARGDLLGALQDPSAAASTAWFRRSSASWWRPPRSPIRRPSCTR